MRTPLSTPTQTQQKYQEEEGAERISEEVITKIS